MITPKEAYPDEELRKSSEFFRGFYRQADSQIKQKREQQKYFARRMLESEYLTSNSTNSSAS